MKNPNHMVHMFLTMPNKVQAKGNSEVESSGSSGTQKSAAGQEGGRHHGTETVQQIHRFDHFESTITTGEKLRRMSSVNLLVVLRVVLFEELVETKRKKRTQRLQEALRWSQATSPVFVSVNKTQSFFNPKFFGSQSDLFLQQWSIEKKLEN